MKDDWIMYNPTVSVIINTYNRGAHLKRLLDALSRQTYENFEVIVVNGPSTDQTKEILRQYQKAVRICGCPVVNLSVSRNIGIRKAAGEIIAFIDDDAIPQDVSWIENAVAYFENAKVGIVSGTVFRFGDQVEFRYGWFDIWGHNHSVQDKAVVYDDPKGDRFSCGQGCNLFFRRDAIVKAGGYDMYYAYYLDESDLGMRIIQGGYTCRYGEHIAVIHEAAPGPYRKDEYHENWYTIARSHGYFVMKATESTEKTREERAETARQSIEPRIEDLQWRLDQQLISQDEYTELKDAIRKGTEQGIKDSENQRRLDYSIGPVKEKFSKYDKAVSSGHQNLCVICDSSREEISEYTQSTIKDLSKEGNHVYVVARGERTKLELINGINYCTVNAGNRDSLQTLSIFAKMHFAKLPETLSVLQKLRQTCGVRTVVSPIQDALDTSICCFSASQLYKIGNADKTEKMIRLLKTSTQYGPYIKLAKGKYEVIYSGNNLLEIDDYHVTADSGKKRIPHETVEKSYQRVQYTFSIDEQENDVEFVAVNRSESFVEITRIELRQAGMQYHCPL